MPGSFRFAVKLPKAITHERRLEGVKEPLAPFIDAISGLGKKLGAILVQLPPSFEFDLRTAKSFFKVLRRHYTGAVVLEPRHMTWFQAAALAVAEANGISRVVADPAPKGCGDFMHASNDIAYFRLHGSPRIYFSSYPDDYLATLAERIGTIAARRTPVWCIFDNTGAGAAAANALTLIERFAAHKSGPKKKAVKNKKGG
ncbi:MAG: hypothetical protein JWN94_2102 [Betaproteobacteria bacterium]|nr:hypothetical protein [Betaproteobacteria bacterium]